MDTEIPENLNYQVFLNLKFKESDHYLNSFLGDKIYYISNNTKMLYKCFNSEESEAYLNKTKNYTLEDFRNEFIDTTYQELHLLKYKYPFINSDFKKPITDVSPELVDLIVEIFNQPLYGYILGVNDKTYYFPIIENQYYYDSFELVDLLEAFSELKKNTNDLFLNIDGIDEAEIDLNNLIEVNEETNLSLFKIQEEFKKMANSGELVKYASFIQKSLTYFTSKNKTSYSKLYIDEDYKIFLIDYNIEVKMNSLTKAVYLYFLKASVIHPNDKGIDVDTMYSRFMPPPIEGLIDFYTRISNLQDYDKQVQSVNNVLSNKDLLYMHFSRIKSAFYSAVHPSIADKYILKGKRGENKYIDLTPDMVISDDSFINTDNNIL